MIFNEQINMSEPAAVVPNPNAAIATNGNGRAPQVASAVPTPPTHNVVPPPAETVKPAPKVSTNSSRSYIRKPPAKK